MIRASFELANQPRTCGVEERFDFMKALIFAIAVVLLCAPLMFAQAPPAGNTQPATAPQTTSPSTATAPPETAGAAPLRVMVGKSLLINTTERLKRVSVTDPSVADALVVTPTQVLVNGLAPGEILLH